MILGSIWKTWFDVLDREPQVDVDEFFAVPIQIQKGGPEMIPYVLEIHQALCTQVRSTLDKVRAKVATNTNILLDPRYFRFLPLCEALVAVFDEYNVAAVEEHTDGEFHYDDVAQKQIVLLVRTGYETGLSAPISFDSLKHESLPLARDDGIEDNYIVRVPLQVGVRFVASLLCREEAAFPSSRLPKEPSYLAMIIEGGAVDLAEEKLAWAIERGALPPFSTTAAMRKAMRIYGTEDCPPGCFDPAPFRLGWV